MIDWNEVAPMIVAVVMFITIGGIAILRPIAKHLGAYLEALTRQQMEGGQREDLTALREILETMNQRLTLMEERQDFTERLLQERNRKELPRE